MQGAAGPAFLTLLSFRADSVSDVHSEQTSRGFLNELSLGQLGSMRRSYAVGFGASRHRRHRVCSDPDRPRDASTVPSASLSACPAEMARRRSVALRDLACSLRRPAWRVGLRACEGDRRLHAGVCALRDRLARQFRRPGAPRRSGSARTAVAHASRGRSALARGRRRRFGRCGPDARACAAHRRGRVGRPGPVLACSVAVLGVAVVVGIGTRLSARTAGRIGSLLQIFRSIGRSPREGADDLRLDRPRGVARIAAAVAIAMALGVPRPIWVAVVLLGGDGARGPAASHSGKLRGRCRCGDTRPARDGCRPRRLTRARSRLSGGRDVCGSDPRSRRSCSPGRSGNPRPAAGRSSLPRRRRSWSATALGVASVDFI